MTTGAESELVLWDQTLTAVEEVCLGRAVARWNALTKPYDPNLVGYLKMMLLHGDIGATLDGTRVATCAAGSCETLCAISVDAHNDDNLKIETVTAPCGKTSCATALAILVTQQAAEVNADLNPPQELEIFGKNR